MDRKINIDSIRALEEQIREHERAAIKLKRARNSLRNVSKLPPELFGKIFCWNVIREGDFDELNDGSHNFLLVCHHWFEVASRTPELWCFWGNTLIDWARWCHCSETALLDLVLGNHGHYKNDHLYGTTLPTVLQDRATRNTIRSVHLTARDSELVNSIIALLTPSSGEEL